VHQQRRGARGRHLFDDSPRIEAAEEVRHPRDALVHWIGHLEIEQENTGRRAEPIPAPRWRAAGRGQRAGHAGNGLKKIAPVHHDNHFLAYLLKNGNIFSQAPATTLEWEPPGTSL